MKNKLLTVKDFIIIILKKFLYFYKLKKKTFELVIINKIINPKSTIFDIGANLGQTVDKFLFINKNLYFYIFEPHFKYFNYLKKKYAENNNIQIFNYGIGSKDEIRNFYFTKNIKHQYAFSFNKANYLEKKKKVKIIRLDSKFKKIKNIDLIKIDVEGLEYQVLLGAQKIIKKNKPFILLEVTSSTIDECISLLKKLEYTILVYEYYIFKNPSLGWSKNNVIKSNVYKNEFYKIDNFLNKKNKSFVLNLFVFKKSLRKSIKNYSINSINLP
jgi:FkbM family methyltransferase